MWTAPRDWVVGELVTAAILNTHIRDNLKALAPVGTYQYRCVTTAGYEVANILDGCWAECNHAAINRTTYANWDSYVAALAPVRPFGAGDGSTTVNVPDLFGRSPWGMGSNASVNAFGDADAAGAAFRRPQHQHTPHTHATYKNSTGSGAWDGGNNGNADWITAADGGSGVATDPLDAPAYQVGGIWLVKVKI